MVSLKILLLLMMLVTLSPETMLCRTGPALSPCLHTARTDVIAHFVRAQNLQEHAGEMREQTTPRGADGEAWHRPAAPRSWWYGRRKYRGSRVSVDDIEDHPMIDTR